MSPQAGRDVLARASGICRYRPAVPNSRQMIGHRHTTDPAPSDAIA